jgi:hypothetical protein
MNLQRHPLRYLTRLTWCLLAGPGLFGAPALGPATAGDCACQEAGRRVRPNPIHCDWVRRLELDYRNDQLDPPEAFNVNRAFITAGGEAHFHVIVVADDDRFYSDVSGDDAYTRMRVRPPMGRNVPVSQRRRRPALGVYAVPSVAAPRRRRLDQGNVALP